MATGFTVMDALNKNSKAGVKEAPRARFRTKDISIFKMYRNEMNFYSIADVEELAGDILTCGLKQNLELVYEPCEKGEYRIVAGERRWLALKYLVSKGYKEFEIATSKLTTPQDADEEQVEIIIANAYRNKNVADMIEEEKRLKASLEKLKAAGKTIKGYDLSTGRLRDVIASMLHVKKTKVAQIEAINNNLIPELQEELKSDHITFSAAYELSGMTDQEQQKMLEQYKESGELSHKEVKNIKEGKAGQQAEKKKEMAAGGEYQTPHPEVNKAEAEKTDELCYSEEQDRNDRETKKKLQEKANDECTHNVPAESGESDQQVHHIRIGTAFFDDVCSGKKSFELRKNDRGYEQDDILEMSEFTNGKYTSRSVRAQVTYILEDFAGLKEGYCIMAIKVLCVRGFDRAVGK